MTPAPATGRPRILYLDAYDSFSNNIIAQLEQCTDAEVVKCYIDSDPETWHISESAKSQTATPAAFINYAKAFDAIVAGPGPGSATCDEDVGWIKVLWKLQEEDMIPVLSICLGFQSMCHAFGADIQRLQEPRHGLIAEILHSSASIFNSVRRLQTTQYHSLQVMLDHRIQTTRAVRYPTELWKPTEKCPDLQPLAWDFDNKQNGAVLMAARHTSNPFWGVQFHPESICTNDGGAQIIQNWWNEARSWNYKSNSKIFMDAGILRGTVGSSPSQPKLSSIEALATRLVHGDGVCPVERTILNVQCATTGSGRLTVSDMVELFEGPRGEAIVLESGLQRDLRPMAAGTGRHSIIGLIIPGETMRLHYSTHNHVMELRNGNDKVVQKWHTQDPWQWIKLVTAQLRGMLGEKPKTTTWAPFWGGFMGYASYEAGLETINVQPREEAQCPDICFAYITRSIVVDHHLKKIYIQSIRSTDDGAWISESLEKLYDAVGRKSLESSPNATPLPRPNPFEQQDPTLSTYLASCTQSVADRDAYCASVLASQKHIADGQSYELCLTTANEIHARKPRICRLSRTEVNELSWKLYKRLTSRNTAPFSAYMRLHNVHVLSSSPERYISWDRQQTAQCRPIKGTVSKDPGVTAAHAHDILSSPKERAENLMIVDLVRHQLHSVYGAGNVNVSQLMQVEEYETVFQLVSVVEGIPPSICSQQSQTPDYAWQHTPYSSSTSTTQHQAQHEEQMLGFEAFTKSLPPGSMTGAPKKRSCELLHPLEGPTRRRGIYSGVLGYLDIGGAGDFSVVIRTAVKIDTANPASATEDVWTIGAGGAITALSDPHDEYEEMLAKFRSTARAFEDSQDPHVEEVEKTDLRGVWSRLMEVEEPGDGDEDVPSPRLLLRTLQDFQAGLLSGVVRTTDGVVR
ncbi:para-aminobenzoate synthase component 1 [Bimuria novae-zelandiae CBS 107.79]|uniref:aminodeoxychorismate synthase n=1 Tax=Bimuria novae-zelandiae CBS 107.79 TaxID=1447943 RepID=A0A6A5VN54_9PLEO|nr:para-aminobenzoate synthase component 1 [Bimuria novae-zelandiae CBS 107.79]